MMEKPKRRKFRQETVVHSYIHRPLSLEIIRLIWNTNITANQITIFRIIFNIFALMMFIQGTTVGFIVGFLSFQINEILDHVDGMYSRLKNQTSNLGVFLEVTFDDLFAGSQGLLGLSVAYGAHVYSGNLIYIWLYVTLPIAHGLSMIYLINFETYKICKHKEFNNIDHDSEVYMQIVGVPLWRGLKNLVMTIVIWKNEILVWGALFYTIGLNYNIDLILLGLVFHSIIYNAKWIKKVIIGYQISKKIDKESRNIN